MIFPVILKTKVHMIASRNGDMQEHVYVQYQKVLKMVFDISDIRKWKNADMHIDINCR